MSMQKQYSPKKYILISIPNRPYCVVYLVGVWDLTLQPTTTCFFKLYGLGHDRKLTNGNAETV